VDFSFFDLLSDQGACPASSIYGNFDLVLCCNLLFYYKPEFRTRILEKLSNTLAPGGFLVTGETEREILLKNGYREYIEFSSIFLKPEQTL
jgi:chemotaxis methyl-accepting protein methylase